MCLTCCDCGKLINRKGRRGRKPKRCRDCRQASEHKRLAARNRAKPKNGNPRKSRKQRIWLRCVNAQCNTLFETTAARAAKGHRFCCRDCSYPQPRKCQNPSCGRQFRRRQCTNNAWKGKGLYCCRNCYLDHRWGQDRPRKPRSLSARLSASQAALATSLRKRCKVFGVTFDPACTRQAVLERDSWVCQKCRKKCNKHYKCVAGTRRPHKRNAEHDHIIPLSVQGSPGNVFENSQCLCRECNGKKHDKPQGQLRLAIEEEAWGKGVRVRRQPSSRFLGATLAAAQ